MSQVKVVIVGAGPAGIAAAIQLKRTGIPFLLLEKKRVGGLLNNANLVENYPGFPKGIPGHGLVAQMQKHLQALGIEVQKQTVEQVEFTDFEFRTITNSCEMESDYLILATGTTATIPQVRGWKALARKHCFTEVVDLNIVSGKKIAILGSGDAAFDYALNLAAKNQVTINMRTDRSRCLPLLRERVKSNSSIQLRTNRTLDCVESFMDNIRLTWRIQDQSLPVQETVDFILAAVGRTVTMPYLGASVKDRLDELHREGRLHMIGDMVQGRYRQTAIAVGDGIKAAMQIETHMRERNHS